MIAVQKAEIMDAISRVDKEAEDIRDCTVPVCAGQCGLPMNATRNPADNTRCQPRIPSTL